jgi:P-type Cu+ transporter
VYELLHESGLGQFYSLQNTPGSPIQSASSIDRYRYLDEPSVRERLVDYADERVVRITLRLPAIHCVACVWLLENLFRLREGLGSSRVDFGRRELALSLDPQVVSLGEVAALLDSLGYPPDLTLADLDHRPKRPVARRLWLQIGVAGFAFGNTMLFSLPSYFGLDSASGPTFRTLVGWLSLALSLPVVGFSALDYWRTSWNSLRLRRLTMEVPIAVGIAALFLQSAAEVVSGRGEGYFDSLAGLLFFLLCGRLFQQKTYDRLSFDRDYTAFFPLSVIRLIRSPAEVASEIGNMPSPGEERVALAQLHVGDHLRLRNGELIPADARLVQGAAVVDYSFVTGESEPVTRSPGELLYAGGRQVGGAIEVEMVKPVSESYLASLWNQDAFRKEKDDTFNTLTNRTSRRFTWIILALAVGAVLFWSVWNPAKALRSFTGILIVACPCALALAAPVTLGAAMRILGRRRIYLRNAEVIEALARVDTVVFDKTGTLTTPHAGEVVFQGDPLSPTEAALIGAVTRQSTHPLSIRIAAWLGDRFPSTLAGPPVTEFREQAGAGVEGLVEGCRIAVGSPAWIQSHVRENGTAQPTASETSGFLAGGSSVQVALNGVRRGGFILSGTLRPETEQLLRRLAPDYETALLSGDHARDRERFARLFSPGAALHFNQTPGDKLEFIRGLQSSGRAVMMVGDGLNDAGALRQSDVGVAVVEQVGAFSPASDVILDASRVIRTGELLRFARRAVLVVRLSFGVSALYNVIGLSIAASGNLSPVVCAILMPLSSVSKVAFAVGLTHGFARSSGLGPIVEGADDGSIQVMLPPKEGERP